MARAPKNLMPLDDEPIVIEGESSKVEELIAQVMGADEPIVKIGRRTPDHGIEYCGQLTVTPEMVLEEEIAARWGGGKYNAQFWARGEGETRRKPVGATTVRIAGPGKDPKPEPAPGVAPAASSGGDVELRVQLARMEGELSALKALGAREVTPALDPISMMEKFSTILTNSQPKQPAVDPVAQIAGIVSAVREVVGVGREIAPERDGGDGPASWTPVIDRSIEAIRMLIDENRAQRGARAIPGAEASQAAALPSGAEASGVPVWQIEIAQWVPKLVERAAAAKDPALAADVFLEDVSPATVRQIGAIVEGDPDFIAKTLDQLVAVEPRAAQYREWFTKFLEAVGDTFTPDDAEPAPAPKPEIVH